MARMRSLSLFFLLFLLLSAAGCAANPPVEGVETVSADQIREMIREARESALAVETKETSPTETADELAADTQVYWTDSGQVWHTDRTCSSLKQAKSVRTGTVAEAEYAGKNRPCSYCGE